jgi:hypothetical protein
MLQPDKQNNHYTMSDETTLLRKAMVSYSFDSQAIRYTIELKTVLISAFLNMSLNIQKLKKPFSYKI